MPDIPDWTRIGTTADEAAEALAALGRVHSTTDPALLAAAERGRAIFDSTRHEREARRRAILDEHARHAAATERAALADLFADLMGDGEAYARGRSTRVAATVSSRADEDTTRWALTAAGQYLGAHDERGRLTGARRAMLVLAGFLGIPLETLARDAAEEATP